MASQSVSRPSALAGIYGEMIGEFFGTMVLILFGDGVVATVFLYGNLGANGAASPFATEWIVIILGWGLAVMLGIYVAGTVSGAHINPAVTLAFAARGRHPWGKVLPYWLAQISGAFVAGGILYFVYQGALVHALALNHLNIGDIAQGPTFGGKGYGFIFYTGLRNFVGIFGAFGDEFLGTALLVAMLFAIIEGENLAPQ
jgi:glycerol uptake facilitator protein